MIYNPCTVSNHPDHQHMIEGHGTRLVYMRLGTEGQSVGAEFRVTSVKSPSLSMGKVVKHGYQFEAGPTGFKLSKGDRSVTLDVVKNPLWVDVRAYTTAERARNADARVIAPVVSELLVEPFSSLRPTTPSFPTARAPRRSSAEYLDSSSPAEDMRTRLRELHRCGVAYWREKCLNVDTWKKKPCWTDDVVTWRAQLSQSYQRPGRTRTHRQNLNALVTKSRTSHQQRGARLGY